MFRTVQQTIVATLQRVLREHFELNGQQIVIEQPPSIVLGELSTPLAFELAKRLRKAPRVIAQSLAETMSVVVEQGHLPELVSVAPAGAGYLNFKLNRPFIVLQMAQDKHADIGGTGFRLVEHTSINPNKAAHIGHLRNAILGDTFQRLLRPDDFKTGYQVGVQNYIDNTGVQVADVVVGFVHLEQMGLTRVRELITELFESNQRIDYYCWDLYARVSQWYMADASQIEERKAIRLATLHALEEGGNEIAAIADLIATSVLRRHLKTMQRLGIEYDFLPRESEILSLHFWQAARQLMLEKGVLYQETEGKNKGCYVMRRAGVNSGQNERDDAGPDEEAKVIVRSNGTVTYVGKDIAYHLWKFNLLPHKDFGYAQFYRYPTHTCWISAVVGEDPHPSFGHATAIYNVIDSRQNDPQQNVVQALRGMGYTEAADNYTHFSYEMVALTPRCAMDLGYTVTEEDQKRSYLEVSGRKGFGVKADDLIDRLIAAAQTEVDQRHPELGQEERVDIATQIAVGALRFFMLRFTRNTVIAFDFRDALSFEGETGPYIQYAVVRAANILRKAGISPVLALRALADVPEPRLESLLHAEDGSSIWETWLLCSRLTAVIEQGIATAEPAHVARFAFLLAQQFNNFYHRHHVLNETDADRRTLLIATAAVAQRELTRTLALLGIQVPSVM